MPSRSDRRHRWVGTCLFPPERDSIGEKMVACIIYDGTHEEPRFQVVGFTCVAHESDGTCRGSDHGGWTDTQAMMAEFAEAFGEPGCDVRLILEPIDETEVPK